MPTKSNTLGAILSAHGAHGVPTQKLFRKLCDSGRVAETLTELAIYLCEEGMRLQRIPANAGQPDRELQVLARTACLELAEDYREKGGVVLAREYATVHALAQAMVNHWTSSFRPPTPVSKTLALGIPEEELSDRLCVATLCAKKKLEEMLDSGELRSTVEIYFSENPDESHVVIPESKLEDVLRRIVKSTIWAFDDPNAAQHWLLHGTESSEEKTS